MLVRPIAVLAGCIAICIFVAPSVSADPEPPPDPVAADVEPDRPDPAGSEPEGPEPDGPEPDGPEPDGDGADPELPPEEEPPPPDSGDVVSLPPSTTTTPDGWELTVWAKDETQMPVGPLTTALSSREYEVGATFVGSITGPDGGGTLPEGVLEVGYEIGCGIDMSTSQGVSLSGSAGINASMGVLGTDILTPGTGGLPILGTTASAGPTLGGAITVGLKPGFVNIVPVSKKQFVGADPWVLVDGFRVKIDGCVGESFIRSYAYLTRSTAQSEAVLAWYGGTKQI